MKRNRQKHSPVQQYFVGAEILLYKDLKEPFNVTAKLVPFGAKAEKAAKWLRSFPPVNTPHGDELKRVVFRMPIGYRERSDVIDQYKKRGLTHENARFSMLKDHAGERNTLVYIDPRVQANQQPTQQLVPGPGFESPESIHPVQDEAGSQGEDVGGSDNVGEDSTVTAAETLPPGELPKL